MKKKSYWAIAILVVAAIGLSLFIYNNKITVNASPVALADQGWKASFSSTLQQDAVEKGNLYITNVQNQPIAIDMHIQENGKTLKIPRIPSGEYHLHIKKAAFKNQFMKHLVETKFSFDVHENLEKLSGEKQLREYFTYLIKMDKDNQKYDNSRLETTEDSSKSTDASGVGGEGAITENDYTTTNNQVEGVDEADLVKTDGSFIYSITESAVVISNVQNPRAMTLATKLTFPEYTYPQQLFLTGDTLVVIAGSYSTLPNDVMRMRQLSLTSVYLYDISNPKAPQKLREFGSEGDVSGARLTDNILYLVTNVYPDYWALEQQKEPELRPHQYDSKQNGELQPIPYDNISILPGTLEGDYSVITAIDLTSPESSTISTAGFLGGSEQLYMNEKHLYLTASTYVPMKENKGEIGGWSPHQANTEVFKFELNGAFVEFLASAELTGSLLNQFSMDEHEGHFRAVTTEGSEWDLNSPSKNHLFILDEQLQQVGSVENLARGERIYSARFIQDKAYMVTFKETDPLFVIDVAVPSSPKVLGELKIPGFSNYLHPLDDHHLIGFGYETKLVPVKNEEPLLVTGGMKISLFDISDFSNPVEKDTEIIGGVGTYSALQYDHKALFTQPEKNLFGFPATLYDETADGALNYGGDGAFIYTITPDGISEAARLLEEPTSPYGEWDQAIQRILYIDEELYTVANSEIHSYDLTTFESLNVLQLND